MSTASFPGPRLAFFAVFALCLAALGFALYLQEARGLLPCPLCVIQRIAYLAAGLTGLAAAALNPGRTGRRAFTLAIALFALAGLAVAARQVWFQLHPAFASCGISPEEKFLNALPLAHWWPALFAANGDCTRIGWTLLGFSLPELSFGLFAVIALLGLAAARG